MSKSKTSSELGRDPGVLLVLSGPSGTGKSTLCHATMERFKNLEFSVSFTTRAPRPGEKEGVDYHYVTDERFTRMLEEGAFVEWAEVHGHRYGTALQTILDKTGAGVNLLLDIDPQGAAQIRQKYPSAVLIFVVPPGPRDLEKRLVGRHTETIAGIKERLKNSLGEIRQCTWYDYIIVNDELERALDIFTAVILAEKCRRSRSSRLIERLMTEYGVEN